MSWMSFSPRTKSVLLLVVTLLLGVVLGSVLTGWWVQNRADRVRALRTPGGFVERVIRQVEPMSPAQRDSVEVIARRTARQLDQLRRTHRRQTMTVLDSMRTELRTVLSEEQINALDRRFQHRRHRRGRF
ncbi:hypothetical protein CRI94_14290 [Longibacter salinarum]|uniref:Uncharacterized protein n=1 Tax=Longibacter salinarum TaxID=1850348 RepID=A0A2A8CV94_9BACT|nr:hypothetical protein [Longibacter salinarum]PEN12679.1 hypothetical protein CRI94_14290 [Longibacter salinarum]